MRQNNSLYKMVIQDYFYEFIRSFRFARLLLISYCFLEALYMYDGNWMESDKNWITGIPIVFAVLSAAFHKVSLPFMMYMVPYSKQQREEYIQKSLQIKMIIPLAFACVLDLTAAFTGTLSIYSLILQITTILLITYLCGTLNDGRIDAIEKKMAYGSIRYFVAIPLLACYFGASAVFIICIGSVSKIEFYIVLLVMLIVFLPMVYVVSKRWKTIRSNFADYEILTQTEVNI